MILNEADKQEEKSPAPNPSPYNEGYYWFTCSGGYMEIIRVRFSFRSSRWFADGFGGTSVPLDDLVGSWKLIETPEINR